MSTGNGSGSGLSTDELREAVRAVLADVLPAAVMRTAVTPAPDGVESVNLRTDAELAAFVRRVAALCDDPVRRAAMREGESRFLLASPEAAGPDSGSPGGAVVRVERGAVTERKVKQAAAQGARLLIGSRAVLTPLARDRARSLGVVVDREPSDERPSEGRH